MISLTLLKKHVRADDFDDDDDLLQHYLDAATTVVITATNRTVEELTAIGGGEVPTPLVQAVMMLAGHWYNQRESVSASQMYEVPDALASLVKPYRKLVDDSRTDEI